MNAIQRGLLSAITVMSFSAAAIAQAPAGRGAQPPRPAFWVTTTAWPDGGEGSHEKCRPRREQVACV